MKKLLLGAMLAAACITTDVNAGVLGIRTASDKQAVDADLKTFVGEDYKDVSNEIINHFNNLKANILELKKSQKTKLKTKIQTSDNKQKTAKSILDNVQKESKKISEFFKSMVNKNSRTKIAEKGNKAQEAANKLKANLTDLKNLEFWNVLEEKLKFSITGIANKLKDLAKEANENANKGNIKNLDAKTLLTNLSEKFNDICKNVFGNDKVDTTVDQTSTENTVVQEEAPVVEKKVETKPTTTSTATRARR